MSAGGAQFKSRDDHRRARELEEARKAGTIAAEKDEDGKEINPHIPQYMAQAPWYLNSDAPGLKHQRNLKEQQKYAEVTDFMPRGQKLGPAATVFRKGACTNCGAMTHNVKECVERPRQKGARFTGKDIQSDEMVIKHAHDYAGKRDHWAQYEPINHMEMIKAHERESELKAQHEKQEKMTQAAAKEQARQQRKEQKRKLARKGRKGDEELEENDTDGDTDTDTDTDGEGGASDDAKFKETEQQALGQAIREPKGRAKMSVRNLRIREDTAKYLLNLDVNSAYYDPKTRSMRENPLPGTNPAEEIYVGDNFVRSNGDSRELAALQLYQFEAYEKGQDLHLNADPTTVEMMNKIYREKKANLKDSKANKILEKYGGQEHMEGPPKELLFAQTESYVEYDRSGGVVKGQEKKISLSKYEEDVFSHNHTTVWGSYFDKRTKRWGYGDDHSTVKNSYGTGEAGKRARQAAVDALSRPADSQAAGIPLAIANKQAMPQLLLYGAGDQLADVEIDEAKVKEAMAAAKRNKDVVEDDRKRKYNSMAADDTSAETMEAYYRSKARDDDPMAALSKK